MVINQSKYTIILIISLFISILGIILLLTPKKEVSNIDSLKQTDSTIKETSHETSCLTTNYVPSDIDEVTYALLNSLNSFYYGSQATSNSVESDFNLTDVMTGLMQEHKRYEDAVLAMQPYLNHKDEVISLVALGTVTGGKQLIKTNDSYLQYIRGIDFNVPSTYSDMEYRTAEHISNQKDGFKSIAMGATQIGYCFFNSSDNEATSGKIPYKITDKQRKSYTQEIDRLFSDALKEQEKSNEDINAILFTVKSIKVNLVPDTYEEAKLLRDKL